MRWAFLFVVVLAMALAVAAKANRQAITLPNLAADSAADASRSAADYTAHYADLAAPVPSHVDVNQLVATLRSASRTN